MQRGNCTDFCRIKDVNILNGLFPFYEEIFKLKFNYCGKNFIVGLKFLANKRKMVKFGRKWILTCSFY